jgi:uncharacterized SAM-dependent methyltransferase
VTDSVDKTIQDFSSEKFQPYAYYNEDMDAIEVYFKDESCMTQPLNDKLELYKSFENNEVVGVRILGIKKLLQDKGEFK